MILAGILFKYALMYSGGAGLGRELATGGSTVSPPLMAWNQHVVENFQLPLNFFIEIASLESRFSA